MNPLRIITLFLLSIPNFLFSQPSLEHGENDETLKINHTKDFAVTGMGDAKNWKEADWVNLPLRTGDSVTYKTQMKILYSDSGIYCLFHCEDNQITATLKNDFADLFTEDVVEAFFWTDEKLPMYFEYELSPLNYELPLLVPNIQGNFLGWLPFQYTGNRRTRHATRIFKNENIHSGWTAEFFIPYLLLAPLTNVSPVKGTLWRANFYRIDYDKGITTWQWREVRDETFHDYEKFGIIEFN